MVQRAFAGGSYGVRKRRVCADLLPLAEARPALLAIQLSAVGPAAAPLPDPARAAETL
jgi:hypothetical protein